MKNHAELFREIATLQRRVAELEGALGEPLSLDPGDLLDRLMRNEARFRQLYEQTPAMLHSIDRDRRLLSVSDVWLETLGYAREEVLGHDLSEFLAPASARKALQEVLPAFMRTGECRDVEYQFLCKDGSAIDVLLSATAEMDEAGNLVRSLAVLTNVTEQRRTEAKLRQAQKLEALGNLTGGVAHDFNNLLAIILGNIELIDPGTLGDREARELLEAVNRAARRGAQLTERLLAFARRQTLSPEVFDLNQLVAAMQPMLQRLLGPGVTLETHLAEESWQAVADVAQMESAIINIALNAREAMSEGGRLRIETANRRIADAAPAGDGGPAPGDYVEIAISDSGSGIAPEIVEQVFEPFFTTKQAGQGTGLGLSMVYGFVKQSRGHVAIESARGEGTVLKIQLPRGFGSVEPAAEAPPLKRPQGPRREKVLLVEDDADVLAMLSRMLGQLGFTVLAACDGGAAQAILERNDRIDLLLTDVVLPQGVGGGAVAAAAMRLHPAIKVIYMSGYTQNAVLLGNIAQAEPDLLSKPFRLQDLAARIDAALSAD